MRSEKAKIGEEKNKTKCDIEVEGGKTPAVRKRGFFFFHSAVLQECHSQPGQNELEQWSTGLDLSTSRAGQSAPFDGAADIKQLPL